MEEPMGVIYRYIKKDTGRTVFIGRTTDPLNRIYTHKRAKDKKSPFHQAIREYGYDSFEFDIIEWAREFHLSFIESQWIDHYNTFKGDGYNQNSGNLGNMSNQGKIALNFMERPSSIESFKKWRDKNYITIGFLRKKLDCSYKAVKNWDGANPKVSRKQYKNWILELNIDPVDKFGFELVGEKGRFNIDPPKEFNLRTFLSQSIPQVESPFKKAEESKDG